MYNINIISDCSDENIRIAIITAVNEMMSTKNNFTVRKMKRLGVNAPIWNVVSRQENLMRNI